MGLQLYKDYTQADVHQLFEPEQKFHPGGGTRITMNKKEAGDAAWRVLEDTLASHLDGVTLVCDAEIPAELVDAAEAEIRPRLNDKDWVQLAPTSRPATLVTYFVIRGAELYSGNSVWPQLGVVQNSNAAGLAFLEALNRLGLPTFAQQVKENGARRFVAPMLIHGAFPASRARRFVARVEDEVRRGVVDAHETRIRLTNANDIVLTVGRPAARLLKWAPTYAERLIDSVIEYIESPENTNESGLPSHLLEALRDSASPRNTLKRLSVPTIEFDTWTGYGPELVAPEVGGPWQLEVDGHPTRLRAMESFELAPDGSVALSLKGRRQMWSPSKAWIFDYRGRHVPDGRVVTGEAMALLPRGGQLVDDEGHPVHVSEEGVPMSGAWSRYQSLRFFVGDANKLQAVAADGTELTQWSAESVGSCRLSGEVLAHALGPSESKVFVNSPNLEVHADVDWARVVLLPDGETPSRPKVIWFDKNTNGDLSELFGDGPFVGRINVRTSTGHSLSEPLTIIPGLQIEFDEDLFGPGQLATLVAQADHLSSDLTISTNDETAEIPAGSDLSRKITVTVPRVQWSIRTHETGRLRLADDTVDSSVDDLTSEPSWLLVRSGRTASVSAAIIADGAVLQTSPTRETMAVGQFHHASIPLEVFRDTLRSHRTSDLSIEVCVNEQRFVAVRLRPPQPAGDADAGTVAELSPAAPVRAEPEPTDPVTGSVESAGMVPDDNEQTPISTLTEAVIEAHERQIRLLVPDQMKAPWIRLVQGDRARAVLFPQPLDGLHIAPVPGDISGDIGVEAITSPSLSVRPCPSVTVKLPAEKRILVPGVRRANDLSQIGVQMVLANIDQISLDCATGRTPLKEIEGLFDDERLAAQGLYAFALETDDGEIVDRVTLAILPSAFLFSHLLDRPDAANPLLAKSKLMYAALADRHASNWAALGWPSGVRFGPTPAAGDALAGWARRLSAKHHHEKLTTWSYQPSVRDAHPEILCYVYRSLHNKGVSPAFVNLMAATHHMLSYESVAEESLRMILEAHNEAPELTVDAALAGIAAYLVTTNHN